MGLIWMMGKSVRLGTYHRRWWSRMNWVRVRQLPQGHLPVGTYVPCERLLAAGQTVSHETIHQGTGGRERPCKYTPQWPLHFPLRQGCSLAALVLENQVSWGHGKLIASQWIIYISVTRGRPESNWVNSHTVHHQTILRQNFLINCGEFLISN